MRILSIDDSRVVHAVLDEMLKALGATVVHAYDGPSGFDVLRSNGPFDLVLLDWEMPGWTGLETLRNIRASGNQTPVVMLTSKNSTEDIAAAIEAGANEYAMKPFVSETICAKIETALGKPIR